MKNSKISQHLLVMTTEFLVITRNGPVSLNNRTA